ncbi:MAG: alpha/beta hydrolase [Bacteroidetes bacterium]|nr:alpha/beta hydrolase [Bacteroidota bacterium]
MLRYCFMPILMMLSLSLIAQCDLKIKLWPDRPPGQTALPQKAVETDNHSGNVTRLSDITNPLLEVFLPDEELSNGVAIIVCPGGGYNILAIDLEGYEVAEWLSSLGYTAFVLQYRVPKNRAGALQDIQRAIRLVRMKTGKHGVKKVGVMGFSAGGHLSASAATRSEEHFYEPIDDADKESALPDFAALIYPAYLDDGPNHTLSEDIPMGKLCPPFFIFGTADDGFGNDALVFAQALRNNKSSVELHLLNSGGHGYGLRKGNPAAEKWPLLMQEWLLQIMD